MRVLAIGGAGRICREAVFDLLRYSNVSLMTLADRDERAGRLVVEWLADDRVTFVNLDLSDHDRTVSLARGYDVVIDGTSIPCNDSVAMCVAEAGIHGVNLNGMSHEWDFDPEFRRRGKTFVAGFGMTPGITNLMARKAADQLDSVETIRVSHGAFRPIAFSHAIAETTRIEYDPDLPSRVVFEDGQFVQVPPFARPREISLPTPYGTHPQYIIPHPETITLARSFAAKGVRLIEVRGTWPPKNMRLLHALAEWGFMRNEPVRVGDVEVPILDAVFAHLLQAPEGRTTDLYGYALHVETIGRRNGKVVTHVLTHTHPASDGTIPEWEGLRAYTRCVGIPLGIAAHLIGSGQAAAVGTVAAEDAFSPDAVFEALRIRGIHVHETTNDG